MSARVGVLSLLCVCLLSSASGARPGAPDGGRPKSQPCAEGEVDFHGQCIAKDECCREDVCPSGTVLEFVKEPLCVPCSEAQTQSGASYCASQDVVRADKDLNATYGAIVESFPEKRVPLKEAERAWI